MRCDGWLDTWALELGRPGDVLAEPLVVRRVRPDERDDRSVHSRVSSTGKVVVTLIRLGADGA